MIAISFGVGVLVGATITIGLAVAASRYGSG